MESNTTETSTSTEILTIDGVTYRVHDEVRNDSTRYANTARVMRAHGILRQIYMRCMNGERIYAVNQRINGSYDKVGASIG